MAFISEPFFKNRVWKFDVPTLLVGATHGYCDQTKIPLPAAVHYIANFLPTAVQTAFGVAANEIERKPYWCSNRKSTSAQKAVADAMDVARDKLRSRTISMALHGGIGAAESVGGYWIGRGLGAMQESIFS